MSSNIRAKPLEGHVTDSAGNILRNAQIKIKQVTPAGSYSVDTAISDDSGYFISKPIPNGVYDIYESGIRVSRTIHNSDENSIQCYKANRDNYNTSIVEDFDYLTENSRLNDFKAFIQIESPEIDIAQYGSSFQIYDFTFPSGDPGLSGTDNELWHLSKFFDLSNDSRITTTRFDIEYYLPITALSSTYRRVRWSGVPAIRYFQDSKLVVPLDYFSMVLNYPKRISPASESFSASSVIAKFEDPYVSITNSSPNNEFQSLASSSVVGDVLKVSVTGSETYYGIIQNIGVSGGTTYTITLEKLRSSRYTSTTVIDISGIDVLRIFSYGGMFRSIMEINEEVNERFTVVENIYAQDLQSELYSYIYRLIS